MSRMQSKLYYDLLEIIDNQNRVIEKQSELIAKLTNDNAEKENMINVLMTEFNDA